MPEGGAEDLEAVPAAPGRAGQVDDKRRAEDAGNAAGEKPVWSLRDRVGAQGLRDAGDASLDDVAGRLGRHIARGDAGTAGRENNAAGGGELADRGRDVVPLVGHDATLDGEALAREELREQIAAPVLPRAVKDAVGDRQNRAVQIGSFVFSTSRTLRTTMPLSIAFAMS